MLKAKEKRPHSVHHVKINADEPKRNSSKILLARLPQHPQVPGEIKEILRAEREQPHLRRS
jgi:diphthamide synthase subunit DPH2